MNKRTLNSIIFLIIAIIILIFLVTYYNMNSYTPKIINPCFKFRCDFSSNGNTKIIGPTENVSIRWKNSGKGGPESYDKNSPVTDTAGNIYIANPAGYQTYDDKGNLLSNTGIVYKYKNDGSIIWSFSNVDGIINNTPCIGKNYLYFGCNDGYLYALNFDGRLQWKYFIGGNAIFSSPTIDSTNDNVYIGSQYGLVAVNNKGKLVWSYNTSGAITTCPAIHPSYNILYFTSTNNYLYAINTTDGSLSWQYQAGDAIQSSPAIGPDGTIYFGCNDGYLYAVSPPDDTTINGILVWKFNNGGLVSGQITSSPAIDKSGNIYYTCIIGSGINSQGVLYIIYPNGILSNAINIDNPTNSSPLIDANGNIFVGGGNYIYGISKTAVQLWSIELGNTVESSPVLDSKNNLIVGCNDGFLYSIIGE